jgi:hypothetical protein
VTDEIREGFVRVELDAPQIPEGSVPTASLTIVGFIDPEGTYGFCVKMGGTAFLTEYLGLLDIARNELFRD